MSQPKDTGTITLIEGCMFSGKTSEIITKLRLSIISGLKVILFKHASDNRYISDTILENEEVFTHTKISFPARSIHTLYTKDNILFCTSNSFKVIAIDEGHFFEAKDLVSFCEHMAHIGISVFVSALSSDFRREAFESISALRPKCDKVTQKYDAICHFCKTDNHVAFTLRVKTAPKLENGENKDVGGFEKYKPVCRACYAIYSSDVILPLKEAFFIV